MLDVSFDLKKQEEKSSKSVRLVFHVRLCMSASNELCYVPFCLQVLHLMNKMDLPAPFGPVTAQAPLVRDRESLRLCVCMGV